MATEAQRLIGISLAKIAQSRCGRGGVSLHKNLLVATVLQKARYIFMEEAYQMVHGHYLQANKFLEPEVDSRQDDDDFDDSGIDDIFNSTGSSLGKDDEGDGDVDPESYDKENSPPTIDSGLTYFDLDVNRIQRQTTTSSLPAMDSSVAGSSVSHAETNTATTTVTTSNKRRREVTEHETEEAVLSILPKRIKSDSSRSSSSSGNSSSDDSEDVDSVFNDDEDDDDVASAAVFAANILSESVSRELDELNNNITTTITSSSAGHSEENDVIDSIVAAATATHSSSTADVSCYISSDSNSSSSSSISSSDEECATDLSVAGTTAAGGAPSMEGIDRITSLVSIFSFGNLTRSVSTPDLCSAQAKDNTTCESLQQRTFLAMTV